MSSPNSPHSPVPGSHRRPSVGLLRIAPVLVLISALSVGCDPGVRGEGWNVLLVTSETTRADHLGAWGYQRRTSPRLDALAAEGVLFERHYAVSPRTTPSVASLHTARYPHGHGVRDLLVPLRAEEKTLAEVLRAAGYATGAVQTHPRMVGGNGFEQGFDDYLDDPSSYPTAPEACGRAASWIRRRTAEGRPWFLWLHLMDPHWTYAPPGSWRSLFGASDPRPFELYRAVREGRRRMGEVIFDNEMSPGEVQAFVDLYDAEIRFTDQAIGTLLDTLDDLGVTGRTLVVVTADHGESLGEHDYFFEHGDFGTQPEIHIPLLMRGPRRLPAGERVPWTSSNIDVAPTILDLLGLPPEDAFEGRSLMSQLEARHGRHRPCFGETGRVFHPENDRRSLEGVAGKWRWLVEGDLKLVHRPRPGGGSRRVLYHLAEDPDETEDRSSLDPAALRRLGTLLDDWLEEDPGGTKDRPLDPETREELRSLGYVD